MVREFDELYGISDEGCLDLFNLYNDFSINDQRPKKLRTSSHLLKVNKTSNSKWDERDFDDC